MNGTRTTVAGNRAQGRQSARTDPRISRRRKAVARSRRRSVWIRSAAAVATAALFWGTFFSPLFAVRQVRVVGARHEGAKQVAAAVHLGSDDNLLLLPSSRIARAAEAFPWVKGALVERKLPGTVRIRLIERKPAMVVSLGAARWMIDDRGNVLAAQDATGGLPVLHAAQIVNIKPGMRLVTPEVSAALRSWRFFPTYLRREVVAVFAPSIERISFTLANGVSVRYGPPHQLREKNKVLEALLRRLATEHLRPLYIDVRVPQAPAISMSTVPASMSTVPASMSTVPASMSTVPASMSTVPATKP
jgi:cell division protein FtsQ